MCVSISTKRSVVQVKVKEILLCKTKKAMVRKELTVNERQIIINCHEQGKSYADINKIVGRPKSTIQNVINRYNKENRIENKVRSGRPRKLTERDERKIASIIKKDPFKSAPKIATDIQISLNKTVSPWTVARSLQRSGFKSCTPRKKPFVSEINKKKRLDFAKDYKNK